MRLSHYNSASTSYTKDTVEIAETTHDQLQKRELAQGNASPSARAKVRVAYLLSQYPAISHTFFLHEVLGLRALGLEIETASINPPDRPFNELPTKEAVEAATTEYIKTKDRLQMLSSLVSVCAGNPLVLLRGLLSVLQIPRLTLGQRGFWLLYLAEAMLVGGWMKRRGLKHLHVHFGGPVASVGMLTANAWKTSWSLTVHGPEELLNFDAYHLREKVTSASFVFCISDFCRSQLCQLVEPSKWDKFQVLRLGVDPSALTAKPSKAIETLPLHLVCIGRLVPAKGHQILLEAMLMLQERGVQFRATLIGGGSAIGALKSFVAEHKLADCVSFTGPLSHGDALTHLRSADIFALASFAEGIPVAIMEAMAMGIPCVSTTIAGIPELIQSGVDGLLVSPSNVGALADALESLIADDDYRRRLGERARQRIIDQYNLPLNHALLANAFETSLAKLKSVHTPGWAQ
jgi:colanic acid/amylovoran biosynthesis glycosyltransferase